MEDPSSISKDDSENILQVIQVLEALKQASQDSQQHHHSHHPSNSPAIKALLELHTLSDTILSTDPNLSALSHHLTRLKTLVDSLNHSQGHHSLRSFLTRRVSTHSISRVAGSIESEIQAWIVRESVETLSRFLRDPVPNDDELVTLLTQFEDRVSQGFNRDTATSGGQQEPGRQEDVYVVEVSFPANADPVSNANSKLKRNITDILREAIFKESILDVRQTLPSVAPDMSSLELHNEYACEPGTVVVGSACVECAPGSHYDEATRACLECPLGSYQDETRASTCKPCPSLSSRPGVTAATGARSADACKERCQPGRYYDELAGLCRPCGHAHYQPAEGSFGCLACGPGLTTRSMEAVSRHECRPECEPGQQLSPLGSCEPCAAGHFRPRGRPACEPCPAGYTTETAGSSERRQCNLLLCPAGHYLNVSLDRCLECPRGLYQPAEQRDTNCLACPPDTTTELEGATSADNCTNPCFINGQAQMCQANSFCVFSRDTQNYTCECKPKYKMDDNEQCVYVCDDYCLNGGTCSANNELNRPRCDCPPSFYGERCERKSDFIYIASGIGVGLAMILFIILLIWMICVRTSSSSSSSMSHIAAHPTKQALQSLHAAQSQLDFASLAAAAAAVGAGPNPAATLPAGGPNQAFYYPNGYADSIAPSHQSAYAHYYDDDDHDDDHDDQDDNGWDMPNFYNETYLKDALHDNQHKLSPPSDKQIYQTKGQPEHLIDPQLLGQPQAQMVAQNGIANKDELYDRLKRHLYTGQKGDTTDSGGEDAH